MRWLVTPACLIDAGSSPIDSKTIVLCTEWDDCSLKLRFGSTDQETSWSVTLHNTILIIIFLHNIFHIAQNNLLLALFYLLGPWKTSRYSKTERVPIGNYSGNNWVLRSRSCNWHLDPPNAQNENRNSSFDVNLWRH